MAGGTGLGLYSLAQRVEALEGFYGVEKRDDSENGTKFWFAIPFRADDDADTICALLEEQKKSKNVAFEELISIQDSLPLFVKSNANLSPTLAETNVQNVQSEEDCHSNFGLSSKSRISIETIASDVVLDILLVDDSPIILNITGKSLRKQGHTVTEAVNGEDALKKMEIKRNNAKLTQTSPTYDAVVLDLQMPVMDGLECLKRLRELEKELCVSNPQYRRQRVIACSANSDNVTAATTLKAGATAFMPKPFKVSNFKSILDSVAVMLPLSSAGAAATGGGGGSGSAAADVTSSSVSVSHEK